MPGRNISFANDYYYHVYNRGVDKQNVFFQDRDYRRFLQTFSYYQFAEPKPRYSRRTTDSLLLFKPKIENASIELACYCLMPNHFHFLIKQRKEEGVSSFVSKLTNSYTKYINTKYKRTGPLFQGTFKAVFIETDEQSLHLSRYIHINPLISKITSNLDNYKWSSWKQYMGIEAGMCNNRDILSHFNSPESYRKFIEDQIDYAESLHFLKHQLVDIEE